MKLNLDVKDIFEIAMKIEENGSRFYEIAAEAMTDPEAKLRFLKLAEEEMDHWETFEKMKASYISSQKGLEIDTDEHNDLFLQAWADGHIFRVDVNPFEKLTGGESLADVLKMAMDAEKDSIIFYLGLKESLPLKEDRDKIDLLIWEELNHYGSLSTQLAAIEGLSN